MIKRAVLIGLAGLSLMLGACSFLDKQADERLGKDCSPEARVERAQLFYDLLSDRYGPEKVTGLVKPLKLMQESLKAGASLDPAGDSYKFEFVLIAMNVLEDKGINTALTGFREAIETLRKLPELFSGINQIEAKVGITCAQNNSPTIPPDKPSSDIPATPPAS